MTRPTIIKALIVDDETLARTMIRRLLQERGDFEIVGECRSGKEAVAAVGAEKPDLMFLDVQMPEMDGFAVIETLLEKHPERHLPRVIFVTAYDQYAVRAFQINALDYLLKPFDEDRFEQALSRAVSQINDRQEEEFRCRLLSMLGESRGEAAANYVERFVIKTGGRVFFLKIEEIMWIEAEANYVSLHASGGKNYLFREAIGSLEKRLDPRRFQRTARGSIVNLEYVRELYVWSRGDYKVILNNGTELKLSSHYRDNLNKYLAGNL